MAYMALWQKSLETLVLCTGSRRQWRCEGWRPPGLWSRSPSNSGWSRKYGSSFNRNILWGKRGVQILQ